MENVTHDENTMNKVNSVLVRNGFMPHDVPGIISDFQNAGILFRERGDDKDVECTQAEQPKEWIERQEEERRAWAIGSAIEHIRTWDEVSHGDVVKLAGEIETFVKGDESKDLNDVDAQDTFYGVLFEILKGGVPEEEFLEEYMIHIVDQLAKNGVRLKDGERSDMP